MEKKLGIWNLATAEHPIRRELVRKQKFVYLIQMREREIEANGRGVHNSSRAGATKGQSARRQDEYKKRLLNAISCKSQWAGHQLAGNHELLITSWRALRNNSVVPSNRLGLTNRAHTKIRN